MGYVYQGLVEPPLLAARSSALVGVVTIGNRKGLVALDLPDSLSP